MARERADVEVPPTLRALLAARLDQLDEPERSVLERGSIEGELFHRGAVQALAPQEAQVTARLTSLVRRDLVRPDRAQLAGEDAFRFRHLLIRDAAYEALPKSVRAELHAALRRLARRARRARRAGRDRRLPPRAGGRLPPRARAAGGRPGGARRRAACCGRAAGALARGSPRGGRAARARADADSAAAARRPARGRSGRDLFVDDPRRAALLLEARRRACRRGGRCDRRGVRARDRRRTTGSTWASATRTSSNRGRSPRFRRSSRLTITPPSSMSGTPSASESRTTGAVGRTMSERASRRSTTRGWRASSEPGCSSFSSRSRSDRSRRTRRSSGSTGSCPRAPDAYSLVNRAWLLAMLDRFDEAVPLARESNARLRDLDGRRFGEARLAEIASLQRRPRDGSGAPPRALRMARRAGPARLCRHLRCDNSAASSACSAASTRQNRSPSAGMRWRCRRT